MAILEMTKIQLLSHRDNSSEALEVLQRHGAMEFTEIRPREELIKNEEEVFELNYVSSRLDFAVSFLSTYHKPSFLKTLLEGGRVNLSRKEIEDLANSFYFNDIIENAQELEKKLNKLHSKLGDLEEEKKILEKWLNFKIPLHKSLETKHTRSFLIEGREKEISAFQNKIKEDNKLELGWETLSETTALATIHKTQDEIFMKTLGQFKVETVSLPKRRGTAGEEIERIERSKKKTEKKIAEAKKEAEKLATEMPNIKVLADYMNWKKDKHNVLAQAIGTKNVCVFEGWAPLKKLEKVKRDLKSHAPLTSIQEINPEKDEQAPVEIENKGIIKPFESVTRLYGMPGYSDIDPTFFLAGFFFIFFGLCLTDVGYGITLFGITATILSIYTVPKGMKLLLKLLMFGGLASTIIGLFFGGYLGIDPSILPEWAQRLQRFDPISNPLPIFYLSLVLGFLQVVTGIILKIVRDAKNGMLVSGLIDKVPWLLLFMTIALFVGQTIEMFSLPANSISFMAIFSLILIVMTQGRKEKGVHTKLFKGTLSLYDSIGYFSDVLSYSRLLALGLATSALAFSINMIAVLVRDMIPVIGPILMVLVLVIGHIFNLAVNVLGAFIHSARLQFVEFFGKFVTDTGRSFKPFHQEERNINLLDER